MNYEIISIGDSAFLAVILNAIAAIAQTANYSAAAAVGATMGVILTLVRGIIQFDGRGLRYQDMLAAVLLYLVLFVPGVKVTIEDAYSGEVRVVDNVPMGPAVAGSLMSTMGYRLTRLFEQAFNIPTASITENGFADALQVMMTVRRNLLSRIQLGKANAPTIGADVSSSFINYIKDCTYTGVDLGLSSLDAIGRNPNLLNAIRFDSQIYTTEIYLGGPPQILQCTDAWEALNTYATNNSVPALEEQLKEVFGLATTADVQPRITNALNILTSNVVTAQDYMLSALITPMFEKATAGRYEESMKWSKAATVEQAIQQRNGQWAAEQTLFTRIVRPMMTWIEGFSYAITPLMVFAIMLGATGIRITGQYFLMLLWIQLWMPILAIINLYINMSASGQMAALTAAQFNLPSIYGIYHMDMILQDWLGVGGMLASSTPAIALMLIYGGSITATHFLGRMQKDDFIDEKQISPSAITTAPVLAMRPMAQYAQISGTMAYGAERVLPTFTAGRDLSTSVSSASSSVQQASENFLENLSTTASQSASFTRDGLNAQNVSTRMATSRSQTDRFMAQTGEAYAQRYSQTGLSGNDFASIIGGAVSLGGHVKNIKGEVSDRLQNYFKVSQQQADQIATDISSRVTEDQGWQTELARNISSDAQTGTREVASLHLQAQDLSAVQRSAADLVQSSETYNASVSAQSRFGATASYGAAETGLRFIRDEHLMSELEQTISRFGLSGDTQRLSAQWRSANLMTDKDQAYAAAGVALLTGHSSPIYRQLNDQERSHARMTGYQLLANAWDSTPPDMNRQPEDYADLGSQSHEFGQVRAATHSSLENHSVSPPFNELNERVTNQIDTLQANVAGGDQAVQQAHGENQVLIANESNRAVDGMTYRRAQYFQQQIHRAAHSGSLAEFNYDKVGGSIYDTANKLEGVGQYATGALAPFINEYEKFVNEGKPAGRALADAFQAVPDSGRVAFNAWLNQEVKDASRHHQLTDLQQGYYKAALTEAFAGHLPAGSSHGATGAIGQQLKTAHGEELGEDISQLLRRAATQNRPDLLDLIGNYNKTLSPGKNGSL